MLSFVRDGLRANALKLAAELRAEKLRVEVFPEVSPKLEKPLKYAAGRHVPALAILGENGRGGARRAGPRDSWRRRTRARGSDRSRFADPETGSGAARVGGGLDRQARE